MSEISDISVYPVDAKRWDDLEELFGEHGPVEGCWCMYWRLSSKDYKACSGTKNKASLKQLVDSGQEPGLLAYRESKPVGWCSLGPRESYSRLERSRILRRIDDKSVWSVVCFYVDKNYRGSGVADALLIAAIRYARKRNIRLLESYPMDPSLGRIENAYAYTGVVSMFERQGFEVVSRRGKRATMRLKVA